MKPLLFVFHLFVIVPAILGQPLGLAFPDMFAPAGGEAQPLGPFAGYLILFVAVGLVLAVLGYKLFDECVRSGRNPKS